ncbi:MAG: ferrochelatase [Alphaproteobacteria bacterium]|nr:ferrochelatase [Alphaproteobacteria bacterium]
MGKTAIVLFNLGGPDRPEAVQPFLFNLFNDRAILRLPQPMRYVLARLISSRRAPVAREIYAHLGGGSPILPFTQDQALALEAALASRGEDHEYRAFIAMRYWHPMSLETAAAVKAFAPDEVVLLPLYPQFSTTTSASSLAAWQKAAATVGLEVPAYAVCCYPLASGFCRAVAGLLGKTLDEQGGKPRVLFSAHGLPKKIVAAGDPYAWQVNETAKRVVAILDRPELDWTVCYQSKVGPLEWTGPSLDDEIKRAAKDRVAVVVVPIAFVSEHSETLVELDIQYREMAAGEGVPGYARVATVGSAPEFVQALAELATRARQRGLALGSADGARFCPESFLGCPNHE